MRRQAQMQFLVRLVLLNPVQYRSGEAGSLIMPKIAVAKRDLRPWSMRSPFSIMEAKQRSNRRAACDY
jgi:hypothetical protein